jgi:hypothetical protein
MYHQTPVSNLHVSDHAQTRTAMVRMGVWWHGHLARDQNFKITGETPMLES